MRQLAHSEAGHTSIAVTTMLAGLGLIILTLGVAQANTTLAWIGGIGAAVLLLVQFALVHAEFRRLWQHVGELEKDRNQ